MLLSILKNSFVLVVKYFCIHTVRWQLFIGIAWLKGEKLNYVVWEHGGFHSVCWNAAVIACLHDMHSRMDGILHQHGFTLQQQVSFCKQGHRPRDILHKSCVKVDCDGYIYKYCCFVNNHECFPLLSMQNKLAIKRCSCRVHGGCDKWSERGKGLTLTLKYWRKMSAI